jgi:anti-sigma regulatory factor (Ser/Thr protein kinase)
MPTGPWTVPTGNERHFPYPSRALAISCLTLAAVPAAAGCSRRLVRLGLNRWGLVRMTDDAELVVSELAVNAVRATGRLDPNAKCSGRGNLAAIHVRLLLFDAAIVIEVWDRDCAGPAPRDVTGGEEAGRGLSIVAALSAEWNYFLAPQGGKVVWAELLILPDPGHHAGLPQRSRCGAVAGGQHGGLIRDLVLLRRIHRGLKNLR